MKKFNFTLLVCLLLAGIFASCDDDDKYPVPPEVSIESVNGVFAMPQEDSIVLKAKVESPPKEMKSLRIQYLLSK